MRSAKAWGKPRLRSPISINAAGLCWKPSLVATRRLAGEEGVDTLYVTGGGSELPLVARVLREEFGRKVKRSEYTRSATAIGLAIQADVSAGYTLREMFTRNFGVWREGDAGRRMVFDSIFPRTTPLPGAEKHRSRYAEVTSLYTTWVISGTWRLAAWTKTANHPAILRSGTKSSSRSIRS